MRHPPLGYTIFCEDIRDEASGQATYVGVYDGLLNISTLPVRIRRLRIVVNLRIPEEDEPENISIKVSFPGAMDDINQSHNMSEIPPEDQSEGEDGIYTVRMHINLLSFPITEQGTIDVTGSVDGVPYQFGSLKVRVRDVSVN